jgi:hypothetical protein
MKPFVRWSLALLAGVAYSLVSAQNAQSTGDMLGRLLTSPDERLRMDNIRSSKSQLGVDKSLTYRGTVLRQGRNWIWLNDQVLDANADSALQLHADNTLTIVVGDKSYRLRPGQTLVPSQGIVQDPMQPHRLTTP